MAPPPVPPVVDGLFDETLDGPKWARDPEPPPIAHLELDGRVAIRCRECEEMTHDLKLFPAPKVVLLPYLVIWEIEPITACPRCMRWQILRHAAIGLITAHVLWPVVILIPCAIHFLLTFRPGHSATD
jgi:hypothetical protein